MIQVIVNENAFDWLRNCCECVPISSTLYTAKCFHLEDATYVLIKLKAYDFLGRAIRKRIISNDVLWEVLRGLQPDPEADIEGIDPFPSFTRVTDEADNDSYPSSAVLRGIAKECILDFPINTIFQNADEVDFTQYTAPPLTENNIAFSQWSVKSIETLQNSFPSTEYLKLGCA